MAQITDEDGLRRLYKAPSPRTLAKEVGTLDEHCRAIIAASPFFILATSDGTRLDTSPKGDGPGSVQVESDETLLLPDWPGNNRLDGLRNILAHPQIAMIFLVPGMTETLRVNGAATIHDDDDLRARFEVRGKRPITVTRVTVETAFMHCPKAFIRADLWKPETWPDRAALPTMAEIIRDHAELAEAPVYPDDETMKASGILY